MDRFVVRTKREAQSKKISSDNQKELKQTTILSLKRVVVVEDIERAKALLEIKDQDKDIILEELSKLKQKIPSREVPEETKIGLTLNSLRKHRDPVVAERARSLYKEWRNHFKDQQDKPKIEVRADNETTKLRESGRKLIRDTISSIQEASILAEATERCIFEMNGRANALYKKHIRSTVFILRHQPDVREKLGNKSLTVRQLSEMKHVRKKT